MLKKHSDNNYDKLNLDNFGIAAISVRPFFFLLVGPQSWKSRLEWQVVSLNSVANLIISDMGMRSF